MRKAPARGYRKIVHVLHKLGDLEDPKKMRPTICTAPVSEARKELYANAYEYYCKFKEYAWSKPRFVREEKPFFLPIRIRT